MVSTRGIKYKFGEGEKVLCYEPDPTKAKVLYDSKVLEVVENKDKRGKKSIEYLIHFQGWNSSWDRCVGEDYVLKDTEENRQLQKDLAAKSQLQIGAYLYRRCRNKRSRKLSDRIHDSLNHGGKVRRGGSSEDGSSCSTIGQRDNDTDDTQHDDADSETCSSLDNAELADDERVNIDLGEILKSHMEHDFDKVKLQNKLHKLPVKPNVVTILENYVKHYATQQLTTNPNGPSRRRKSLPTKTMKDLDRVCKNLNICKEVCDGLRIYFDFTLKDHLLYMPEAEQLNEYLINAEKQEEMKVKIKTEIQTENEQEPETKPTESPPQSPSDIPLFAHLSVETSISIPEIEMTTTTTTTTAPITRSVANQAASNTNVVSSQTSTPVPTNSILNEPRRLRSHKVPETTQESVPEKPQTQESTPVETPAANTSVTNVNIVVKEEKALSIATTSSRCSTPRNIPISRLAQNSQTNNNLPPRWNEVLKQVEEWKIVPADYCKENPTAPSLIYGAVHLTRLLVKLPEFLSAANLPVEKLTIIMKHIDLFIDYLEEHKEWYEETEEKRE